MKLTTNNISFVKELTRNGQTYSWYVGMKSGYVSDGRSYSVCSSNELPKTVQKFLENSTREEFSSDEYDDTLYVQYIYR